MISNRLRPSVPDTYIKVLKSYFFSEEFYGDLVISRNNAIMILMTLFTVRGKCNVSCTFICL